MLDTGNVAWMLMSTALVFFMTPGLAFFYGGMVRSKNVLNTIMHSIFMIALITIEWVLIGYTLVFGDDIGGIIGSLNKLGLEHVAGHIMEDTGIPELLFAAFQCMFAVITPALIAGSFAERIKFKAFVVFAFLWSIFIYNPMAHWVWGGGWLARLGALDFAGGLVIHILSGVSGLVLCILLGKRHGYGKAPMLPHHLPMVVLGASMLWFGWFGFNGGSALGANELAVNAFMTTQVSAAAGALAWVFTEWLLQGKPTLFGAASGCVAGLVAITPGAGFVGILPSIWIGALGGAICYLAVAVLKNKLGYDDSLDAFGVHGVGGTWGAIATGIWGSMTINPAGANGLYYGETHMFLAQILSIVIAYALAIVGSYLLYKVISLVMDMRVNISEETAGMDIVQHGESAYNHSIFSTNALSASGTGSELDKLVASMNHKE